MKNLTKRFRLAALAAVVIAAFTLQACDITSTDDEGHADAVGFVIVQNNVEILRFENNQYTWNPSGTWDDYFRDGVNGIVISPEVIELTPENPRGMTPSVFIRWIDADGDLFDLPDLTEEEGGEYWLNWEWEKPNVLGSECSAEAREDVDALNLIRPANLEQHGSDGQWGFHFRADHAGQDRVRFRLMHEHGSAAHSDFTSQWLTVVVADDDHDMIDENGIYQHTRNKCRVDRPRN
jgi:hypothetical protein